jgi:hypothetical protein
MDKLFQAMKEDEEVRENVRDAFFSSIEYDHAFQLYITKNWESLYDEYVGGKYN